MYYWNMIIVSVKCVICFVERVQQMDTYFYYLHENIICTGLQQILVKTLGLFEHCDNMYDTSKHVIFLY